MNTDNYLKLFAIINLALMLLVMFSASFFQNQLPKVLQQYSQMNLTQENSLLYSVIGFISLLSSVVLVVGLIAIALLKKWSKHLPAIGMLGVLCSAPLEHMVMDRISYTLDSVYGISFGILIGLIYFSKNTVNQKTVVNNNSA